MVFRTTPNLGPGLEDKGNPFYWDSSRTTFINNGATSNDTLAVSYRLGNPEFGSDGHEYIMVRAGGTLAADASIAVDETTWIATANGAGLYTVPAGLTGGVVLNDYFHARRKIL